ncbi:hypothetical protein D3C78_1713320 [compost metagenome]
MENLAGLLVAPVIALPPLVVGEQAQGLIRDARFVGHALQGGDQAVAPEEGREPGHAGGEELLVPEPGAQNLQIARRALQDPVQ